MLTIQIKNWENEVVAVINNIYSLEVNDEVNKWGKLKIKFPTEKWLQEKPLQKGYRISITYGLKIGKVIKLFEWYITDVIVKTTEVEIRAENWLSYLQYRMIRSDRTYTDQTIADVISAVYNELNTTSELPISLWLNDCQTKITKDFSAGTSFYDILKYCWNAEKKLICRIVDAGAYHFLECSENAWNVLEWVWEYDARNTSWTNITDWSWKDSMDEFYTYIQNDWGNINDDEFEQQMKLIFEKFDSEWALELPSGIAIPSISISRDTDWWNFNPWDRKYIRLITGYDWLPIQYLWLIQTRKVNITANGWIKAEIKVSEEYKTDTNILDIVLTNLRGKKASWSWGDMTNYYTKSETTAIINSAVSGKADAVHSHISSQITDFASAVWSLISSALEGYYTKLEVDGALSNKANVSHTHQTSDITGLDTALSNKADKDTTYTKTETDNLLSWKANSSHSHAMTDITWLDDALNLKADLADIPTVNNSTITIQINWTTLKSITLNQATGETINIPVPTKVSDLNNDSWFITKSVNDLTNYYLKSETYTKTEVDSMISNFWWFEVVATLPTTNIKTNVIYLKWPIGTGVDRYEEYIYYSNTWTLIGETSVDLTNYIDKNTPFITINGVAYKFWDSLTTPNTEYNTMTQQEATAGTGTTWLLISPKVLVDTITNMISWKADKSQIKDYVITESMVTVSTTDEYGVSPYNTSYYYTNITINANSGIEWKEWATYKFIINTSMVVASAYRNVRVRIWTNWTYIPLMNAWNSILAGSSYFTKARTDLYVYKTTYQSGGALHMNNDTSYSAMSVAEWKTGTATSGRVMRADYLKQIILYRANTLIWDWTVTFTYDWDTLWSFTLNQSANKTITIPVWSSITELTENFVRTMIFAGVGDYDNVFRASSGLYRILNALDDHDNLGLEKGEVWEDIVSDTTDFSSVTHSYSVMVAVASSKVAMQEVLSSNTATKEISECWNSISIIAESELASNMYLSSEYGITNLFTYQTAQDAFFSNQEMKEQIISEYIMTIVNNNTLLANLYTDTTVANAIANSQEALNTIAGNGTKLNIVKTSATIMSAIATNSSALGNMSDANFTTYILENSTYLTTTTGDTAGQNRINSMDADDLLPAIFYWTGLSGYATFEALAESDSAMEIVQSDTEAMLIINCNEEAQWYLANIPTEYQEVEYIESSWTQRINTWVAPNDLKFWILWKFRITTMQTSVLIDLSNTTSTDNKRYWFQFNGSNSKPQRSWIMYQQRWEDNWVINTSTDYEFSYNYNWNASFTINWMTKTWIPTWNATMPNWNIFCQNCNWSYQRFFKGRLYRLKIYHNEELLRDFYCCYRKSDNVIWLYDKVNGVFYTNQWSWAFTKWPNYKR